MKLQIVCVLLIAFAVCAESEYIDGSYIIQLKDGSSKAHIEEVIQRIEDHTMSSREEMEITSSSLLLPIVYGKFNKETAEMVSGLESVEIVEQDQVVTIAMPYESSKNISIDDEYENTDESDYSNSQELDEMEVYNSTEGGDLGWYNVPSRYNLDVVDNTHCIDGHYTPISSGHGVDIYILDSGINYNHVDFGGRASYGGYDIEPRNNGWDRFGHGTHCAGIAGGRYSGVAKSANLLSIRVLNEHNRGSVSWFMQGMEHAYARHHSRLGQSGFKGSVISMSLGGPYSQTENNLVNTIVSRGVSIVTASGNDAKDACHYSPGSAGSNINVGGHWYTSSNCQKPMYTQSNYGRCVHIVAPGVNVLSANYRSTNRYIRMTGTSMACPHISGVAATMLSVRNFSPAHIKYNIQRYSINDLSYRRDSTQRLYVSSCLLR